MYSSLILHNSMRSMKENVLYCLTIGLLMMILHSSNLLSALVEVKIDAQSYALSALVILILFILLSYLHTYMIKARSKEFALYILLGMSPASISLIYFCELLVSAFLCFVIAMFGSTVMFSSVYSVLLQMGDISISIQLQALMQSFAWFMMLETAILCETLYVFQHKQVQEMLKAEHENEHLSMRHEFYWRCIFVCSLAMFLVGMAGITWGSEEVVSIILSIISVPAILLISSLYRLIYGVLNSLRLQHHHILYQHNHLYITTLLLSKSYTNIRLNAVLSLCLLCSMCSFFLASLFVAYPNFIFSGDQHVWMVFIQYAISLIFGVLFFSILAIHYVLELKQHQTGCNLHHRLGMGINAISRMIRKQLYTSFTLPLLGA